MAQLLRNRDAVVARCYARCRVVNRPLERERHRFAATFLCRWHGRHLHDGHVQLLAQAPQLLTLLPVIDLIA